MLEGKGQRHMRHQGMGTGRGPWGEGAAREGPCRVGRFCRRSKTEQQREEREADRQENAEAGRLEYREHRKEREVGRGTKSREGLETGGRREGASAARGRPTDPLAACFPP